MQVKIDTKEKFHVITPLEAKLSATMSDGIEISLMPYIKNEVSSVVLNCENILTIDQPAAEKILQIQQAFYENNSSFVLCNINKTIEEALLKADLADLLNIAPTVSEAADIVQMEEIERELMDDDML